jgi:alkylation response protein AidB-like acyl-CoA dehydrogenase
MSLDFTLSDEHKLVQTSVGQMLDKFEPKKAEFQRMAKDGEGFPEELWQEYAQAGLTGALIPEEYGGNNMGLLALMLGFETVCTRGFSPGLLLTICMDTCCIVKNGNDEQKQRFLPKIADGSTKFCFAITEPNAGTNALSLETHARRDGDSYIVNGQKTFISGFDVADYMLLVTRTTTAEELKENGQPKAYGLSLFIVDTKSKGIEKTPISIPLSDELNQYTLFFDDLEVPAENLLGKENEGAIAMFNSLNPERILAGAICTGMAQSALTKAVNYAKERKVFKDTPIGAYQSIAHPLAEVQIDLDAARLMTQRAAWAYDTGVDPQTVGSYANMAKYLAAELAIKAVDHAIETHGGLGFAEETGLINQWSGARLFRTAPVSREMILNYVSEWNLGLPKSY